MPAWVDGKINALTSASTSASTSAIITTSTSQAIDFDAQLQPAARQPDASRLNGLHLKNAAVKGRWASGILSLQTLKIETSNALLQGNVDVQLASKAAQGQLQLTLPGGQAQVQGKLSEKEGGGDFALRLSDAGKASRWLETLPGAAKLLSGYAVQGNGELTGAWSGGWRGALQGSSQGADLTVRSTLRVPQLDVSGPKQTPGQALRVRDVQAEVSGSLSANTTATSQAIDFDAQLQPAARQPDASRLNGLHLKNAAVKGRWASGILSLQTLKIETSNALLQGNVDVQLASKAAQGQLQLTLPGGQAQVQGKLSEKEGGGDFALRLSDAGKASRWLETLPGAAKLLSGYAVQGNGELTGAWSGGWRGALQGSSQGADLTVRSTLRVPQLDVSGPKQTPGQALRVRDVQAEVSGSLSALALKASGQWLNGTRRFNLQTQATGGRGATGTWQAMVNSAQVQTQNSLEPGTWTAQIRQPVGISWNTNETGNVLDIDAGESTLTGPSAGTASIVWRPIRWSKTGARSELATQGQLQGVPLAWLDLLANAQIGNLGLRGDLVFDGDWDVLAGGTLKAKLSLVRRSGDISIQAEGVTGNGFGTGSAINAGVKDARVTLSADGDVLRVSARWDSERAGLAQGDFSTRIASSSVNVNEGWRWPADAPLAGTLRAQLPQVGVWSMLAPPGWRIRGTLDANIALAGTRGTPQWSGTLNADSLALRSIADGIEFRNGKLRTALKGQRLEINEFSLQGASGGGGGGGGGSTGSGRGADVGGGGLLNAKGFAEWLPSAAGNTAVLPKIRIELAAQALALRVSARADRRLAVSGNLQVKLLDAKLEIRGALKAEQALFILPDENTPSLGDDVVVKSLTRNPQPPTSATPSPNVRDSTPAASNAIRIVPDVAIGLDMGPDFRVQGRGLNTRLAGALNLISSAATLSVPRLTGTLSTVRGSYKAYGQQLYIEEGVMRFTGPYDNPALDILAIRPNLTVRVGVQVSGTALLPRVRLYAEPELPDAEKLAWLVLGRSGANGGAESAVLQQAALALLGGNGKGLPGGLAEALGLDELSFRGSASNADGTTTSAAAVTLGKRLSRNFYVAYERSLAGTLGTVFVFYDLSKRFTLRVQTGEQSAIDLIFTVPYD